MINRNKANLKKLLVCCLPTQKIRGGSVGRLFSFLIVEVGRSVGFFFFFYRAMYGEHRKLVLVWFAKMKFYNMTILTGLAT